MTAALVLDRPNKPEFADLYSAFVRYALPPGNRADEHPPDVARMLRWLESSSVPLVALEDEDQVDRALSALALRLDGKPQRRPSLVASGPSSTTCSTWRLPAKGGSWPPTRSTR